MVGRLKQNPTWDRYKSNQDGQDWRRSGVFRLDIVFDGHVFKFTGIKDIAAFQALYKFCVFFAGYNADAGMPTDLFYIR